MTAILYKDNDNLIELDMLKNSATDAYLNSATVNLTSIKDSAGVVVTGVTFPLAMSYVATSNGKYQATVDKALALISGQHYTAIVDVASSGIDGHWELPLTAQVRTS
jgi:hypothetical protein